MTSQSTDDTVVTFLVELRSSDLFYFYFLSLLLKKTKTMKRFEKRKQLLLSECIIELASKHDVGLPSTSDTRQNTYNPHVLKGNIPGIQKENV